MNFRLFQSIGMLVICCTMSLKVSADDLRIGAAAVKVTPPLGVPLAGYYYERGADGVHDDLYAKAMVVEKDRIKVAIVECDFVSISKFIADKIRDIVSKSTGIAPSNVMISATHSHTGPVIPSGPSSVEIEGTKSGSESQKILNAYISKLPALIAKSIEQANAALQPAKLFFGLGQESSISFNRRFFMTDGTVGWNPGLHNPKVIKPAGPIDPDVKVLYAESKTDNPIATLVNFALHLDEVGGTQISADMPFYLSGALAKIKGDEMVTIFSQGCSGNINHINVNGEMPQSGQFRAKKNGNILAGEVIKTYENMSELAINNIKARSEMITVPLVEISASELDWARKTAAKYGKQDAAPFLDLVKAFKMLDVEKRNGKPLEIEIQVFALGDDCAIVGFPNEIFTELGMYIKSRSPYKHTIIQELSNGSFGYIPDRKAYSEGNYEPISTIAAPGAGELYVENAVRMLYELKNQ
ncbi:MAG: neutral/alkaline non-lysosomal ceramidase N-terminal domain-containing protein [Chitinophagaceae bacterium]|nr:neutral/alkaline non-lysosomal ceramidase N-terminal domain-containing protein [Chitinophagaceae bacterium]